MAKGYALIDASVPTSKRPCITNQKLCVLFRVDTKAPLECPARSMRSTHGNGYTSLAEQLMKFKLLGLMPVTLILISLMMEMVLKLHW